MPFETNYQKPQDFCLEDCGYIALCVEMEEFYAGVGSVERIVTLACKYEEICRMWQNGKEIKSNLACPGCGNDFIVERVEDKGITYVTCLHCDVSVKADNAIEGLGVAREFVKKK